MHTLLPRLPRWYASWVGLQGDLRRLYCKGQAGHINVQGVHLVLEVSGQLVPSLLQNTGNKDKRTVVREEAKTENSPPVIFFASHHSVPYHSCSKALSMCSCRTCCTLSISSTSFFSCSSTGSVTSSYPRRPSLSVKHSLLTSRGTSVAARACSVCSLDCPNNTHRGWGHFTVGSVKQWSLSEQDKVLTTPTCS